MQNRLIVIMGVSGCGKSTIGRLLAKHMHWPFLEGDDFHPAANTEKMTQGIALSDTDRAGWLRAIVAEVERRSEQDIVLACSALTPFVHDNLRKIANRRVVFCWLNATYSALSARMKSRKHFMPPSLLGSQLDALTLPPSAKAFWAEQPADVLVCEIATWLETDC